MSDRPMISIAYCTTCNYLPRAISLAEELLDEFGRRVGGLTLTPGKDGEFAVTFDGEALFEKVGDDDFPKPGEVALQVRRRIHGGRY